MVVMARGVGGTSKNEESRAMDGERARGSMLSWRIMYRLEVVDEAWGQD